MSKLSILLPLLLASMTLASCTDDVTGLAKKAPGTSVFTIQDAETGLAISGASVRLTVRADGVYFSHWATTDSSGRCTITYEAGAGVCEYFVSHSSFVYAWGKPGLEHSDGFNPVVRLAPVAYIRFSVKTVSPGHSLDFISLSFPSNTMGGGLLTFKGATVDSVRTMISSPGKAYISWIAWKSNVKSTGSLTVQLASRETTNVEIRY